MSNTVITIEKLTEEEWEFAKKMKKLAHEINTAPVGAFITGLASVFIVFFAALYFNKSGAVNIPRTPEVILGYLAEQFVFLLLLFAVAVAVAFLSYFVYFRRRARKKLEEFGDLSKDSSFLPVLRKLCQVERNADEINRMKSVLEAFDSRDMFNSKPLREFLDSLPPA